MFVQRCPETGLHVEKVYKMEGKLLENKYRIGALLGIGGMGVVYEATNVRIGRKLAIKFLSPHVMASPRAVARFENEARIAASVGHRNIVDIIDLGETVDGVHYIVMEYLDGRDLGDILDLSGKLPISRAVDFTIQILSALRAVHEQGIIHRDLKPENVRIVGAQGRTLEVKLVDFGVSRLAGKAGNELGLTRTGTVVGTPRYMAPEQARGRKEIDRRADIYSVGVMLYRMLTGALPIEADGYNEMIIALTTEEPIDVRLQGAAVPDALAEIVMKAISKDPQDRFPSATEFFQAIRPFRQWAEEDRENMDGVVEAQPMLDWSVVTDVTDETAGQTLQRESPSRYSRKGSDNPSALVDVVPGRLRLATVKRDPSGSDAQEQQERPTVPPSAGAWQEPGASRRRTSAYSVVGNRKNPSMVEYVSPAARRAAIQARSNGAVGQASGRVATPVARISPTRQAHDQVHPAHRGGSTTDGSLAGVSVEADPASTPPHRDDSVSIEGWTGPASSMPPAMKPRRHVRRWLMVASAALVLLGGAVGATLFITSRLAGGSHESVSAADAGPARTATVPAPVQATTTRFHELTLSGVPDSARVLVDGVLHPEKPLLLETDRDEVTIQVQADGFERWQRTLTVAADMTLDVSLVAVSEDLDPAQMEEDQTVQASARSKKKSKKKKKKKKGKKKKSTRIDTSYPGLR